jgi:integrase
VREVGFKSTKAYTTGVKNIEDFGSFLRIDLQMSEMTVKEYTRQMRRFFKTTQLDSEHVSGRDLRSYLNRFREMSPNTYKNVLSALKRFFRDYMKKKHLVESFKFPKKPWKPNTVPSREELTKFYSSLDTLRAKTLFITYATTGLRRNEVLQLQISDIDFDKRMIIPNKGVSGTKNTWVSFFNSDMENILREYLDSRKDNNPKLFPISRDTFLKVWKKAYIKTDVHITPKVLRNWFCCEMGRLGIQDRYVDAFCGRTPKSILARHYTDYSPERLKEIYEKAQLTVITEAE